MAILWMKKLRHPEIKLGPNQSRSWEAKGQEGTPESGTESCPLWLASVFWCPGEGRESGESFRAAELSRRSPVGSVGRSTHSTPPPAREDSASGFGSPGNLEPKLVSEVHTEGQGQSERVLP